MNFRIFFNYSAPLFAINLQFVCLSFSIKKLIVQKHKFLIHIYEIRKQHFM